MSRFHSTAAKYSRAFSRLEAEAVVVVINFSTTAVAGAVAATAPATLGDFFAYSQNGATVADLRQKANDSF